MVGSNKWEYYPKDKEFRARLGRNRFAVLDRNEEILSLGIYNHPFYPIEEIYEDIASIQFNVKQGTYRVTGRNILRRVLPRLAGREGLTKNAKASLKGMIEDFESGIAE